MIDELVREGWKPQGLGEWIVGMISVTFEVGIVVTTRSVYKVTRLDYPGQIFEIHRVAEIQA